MSVPTQISPESTLILSAPTRVCVGINPFFVDAGSRVSCLGSCLIGADSYFVGADSCFVDADSCFAGAHSCFVGVGSCFAGAHSCLVDVGSCFVGGDSCRSPAGSCSVAADSSVFRLHESDSEADSCPVAQTRRRSIVDARSVERGSALFRSDDDTGDPMHVALESMHSFPESPHHEPTSTY